MLNRESFVVCQSGDSAGECALENLSCQDIILVQNVADESFPMLTVFNAI